MNITGITAEYNPFHSGHRYQLDWIRKNTDAEGIVVLMSGNYTQRGEPAVFDKYLRAQTAVKNGADLVLELPVVYAASNAEVYASCAIRLLNGLNAVNTVAFGMENPESAETARCAAKILLNEPEDFRKALRNGLDEGKSFISARHDALEKCLGTDLSFMKKPNNILACEYIREILRLESGMDFLPVERITGKNIKSASFIRKAILKGSDVSEYVPEDFCGLDETPRSLNDFSEYLRNRIITMSAEDLSSFPDMEKGLENRFKKAAFAEKSAEGIVEFVSGKRYTKNRIRRILLYILLDIRKSDALAVKRATPSFVKILSANETGRKILRIISQSDGTDCLDRYSKALRKRSPADLFILEKNISSDNLYYLDEKKENLDFSKIPVFL